MILYHRVVGQAVGFSVYNYFWGKEDMNSNIITGQYVRISQAPASIWSRIFARLLDQILVASYIYAIIYVISETKWELEHWWEWMTLLLLCLPFMFYTPVLEMMNNGQTLGKSVLGIRVVMADGTSPTLGALLLRWVLLPFDLYFTGGVGTLFIIFSKNHQRLGDMAAGTMVIKESGYRNVLVGLDEFSHASRHYQPHYPEAANLSQGQADVISRVLEDCNIGNDYDERRIRTLSDKVQQSLNITSHEKSDLAFLMVLLKDYQYFLLEIV